MPTRIATLAVFLLCFHWDVVMGHEFCAEILEHGAETSASLKAGSRVCSVPIAFGPGGVGAVGYSNDYPGGYGELVVLNEMLLLEVPNGLSTERAALTEPMAVGLHAVEKANIGERDVRSFRRGIDHPRQTRRRDSRSRHP